MHYESAKAACVWVSQLAADWPVQFVSPILSVMTAAMNLQVPIGKVLRFSGCSRGYAENNGLIDALQGKYQFPKRTGKQGVTYTKLTKLATHSDVDRCNTIVNDLVFEQFADFNREMVGRLAKVIGELHDNVASHASGAGFSCAQVYCDSESRRIEFAIADIGCGMLRNVQRIRADITDHAQAIQWCLQRRHTTAHTPTNDWIQRLPEDVIVSPYPDNLATRSNEDHHVGEGLWLRCELVRTLHGKLWVLSGNGEYLLENGQERTSVSPLTWSGVAIEVELIIPNGNLAATEQQAKLEELAKRIGL